MIGTFSRFCREPFDNRKFSLVGVAREKLDRTEVQCRGDMQHIEKTMATADRALRRNPLRDIDHFGPVGWHDDQSPGVEIGLQLCQGFETGLACIPLRGIPAVTENLKTHRLAKLTEQ